VAACRWHPPSWRYQRRWVCHRDIHLPDELSDLLGARCCMLNRKAHKCNNGIERLPNSPLRPANLITAVELHIVPNPAKREIDGLCGSDEASANNKTASNRINDNDATMRESNLVADYRVVDRWTDHVKYIFEPLYVFTTLSGAYFT
jgi:hypothetical protein